MLEATFKVLGLRPKHYFLDVYNALDFAVVLASLIGLSAFFFPSISEHADGEPPRTGVDLVAP